LKVEPCQPSWRQHTSATTTSTGKPTPGSSLEHISGSRWPSNYDPGASDRPQVSLFWLLRNGTFSLFFLPSRPGATLSCTRRPRVTLTAARRPTATLASTDRPAAGDPDRRPPPKSDPVLWRPKGRPPEHTSKISPQHTSMVRLASQGPSLCKAPVSRPYTGPASKVLANGHPGLSTAPPAARTKRRPFTTRALRVTLAVASACVRRKGATGDPALSLARPPTVWPSRPWLASSASPASQQHAQNRPPAC
jgi:hypothetical protein